MGRARHSRKKPGEGNTHKEGEEEGLGGCQPGNRERE